MMNTYQQYSVLLKQVEFKHLEGEISSLLSAETVLLKPYIGFLLDVKNRLETEQNAALLLNDISLAIQIIKNDINPRICLLSEYEALPEISQAIEDFKTNCYQHMKVGEAQGFVEELDKLIDNGRKYAYLEEQKVKEKLEIERSKKRQKVSVLKEWRSTNPSIVEYFQKIDGEVLSLISKTDKDIDNVTFKELDEMIALTSNAVSDLTNIRNQLIQSHRLTIKKKVIDQINLFENYVQNEMTFDEIDKYKSDIELFFNEIKYKYLKTQTIIMISFTIFFIVYAIGLFINAFVSDSIALDIGSYFLMFGPAFMIAMIVLGIKEMKRIKHEFPK